jgi:hypothetical protein
MARYNSITPVGTTTTTGSFITPESSQFTTLGGTAGYTVTLATPSRATGIEQTFYNSTNGNITLTSPVGNIVGPGFTSAASQIIPTLSSFTLTSTGTGYVISNNEGGPQLATTITASGLITAQANLTVTGTLAGNGAVNLNPASFNVAISPTGTGTVTINPAGALSVTGAAGLTLGTAGQTTTMNGNISATTSNQTINLSPTGSGTVAISPAGALTINPTAASTINNTSIGASTRSTGAFTTLAANSTFSLTLATGTHTISSNTASGGTGSGALVITGGLGVGGSMYATTIVETSSIAFKENVMPLTNALDAVLQLVGVTYDRRDGQAKNEVGLIAEEVYKVAPNLVTLDEHGNPYGLYYTKITAYLIESIKSLKEEINVLKGTK